MAACSFLFASSVFEKNEKCYVDDCGCQGHEGQVEERLSSAGCALNVPASQGSHSSSEVVIACTDETLYRGYGRAINGEDMFLSQNPGRKISCQNLPSDHNYLERSYHSRRCHSVCVGCPGCPHETKSNTVSQVDGACDPWRWNPFGQKTVCHESKKKYDVHDQKSNFLSDSSMFRFMYRTRRNENEAST